MQSANNPNVNAATQTPAYQYLEMYRDRLRRATEDQNGLANLREACAYLFRAFAAGSNFAELEMQVIPQSRVLLSHEFESIVNLEFMRRLKEISSSSVQYMQAQNIISNLYYQLKYYKVYSNYQTRLEELIKAFKYYTTAEQIQDPSDVHTDRAIIRSAIFTLLNEMCGNEVVIDNNNNFCYPFKIKSVYAFKQDLNSLLPNDEALVNTLINDFINKIATHVVPKFIRRENDRFKLCLQHVNQLTGNKKIVSYQDTAKREIARFEKKNGSIYVTVFDYNVELDISGEFDMDKLIIINPNGNVVLKGELTIKKDILVVSETLDLEFKAKINIATGLETPANVYMEVKNNVFFTKDSEIITNNNFQLKADRVKIDGNIQADNIIQLEVSTGITIADHGSLVAGGNVFIKANAISEWKGKLISMEEVHIHLNDSIYLHGQGAILGSKRVEIFAKSMLHTQAANIKGAVVNLIIKNTLTNEAVLEASKLAIIAENFNNYSPDILCTSAYIRCEDTFTNYPNGIITTTEKLEIRGWSAWNGGKIDFGQAMQIKLNGIFVHGTSKLSVEGVRDSLGKAIISGETGNVVAGAVFNAAGQVWVNQFNLIAIVEAGLSFSVTQASKKSRVISLDVSVNIPNLYADLSKLYTAVMERQLPENVSKWSVAFTVLSTARWVLDILFPGLVKPIDAAWTVAMFCVSARTIYLKLDALHTASLNGQKVEACDIYEIIGLGSNAAILGLNGVLQAIDIVHEGLHYDTTRTPLVDAALPIGLSLLSMMLPTSTDDAVLRVGTGIHANGSILNRSGLSFEFSADVALNISNIFLAAEKYNFIAANNVSNTGFRLNRGGFEAANNDFSNVSQERNSMVMSVNSVIFTGEKLVENATIHANKVVLQATDSIVDTKDSEIVANTVDEVAKHITLEGHIRDASVHEIKPEPVTPVANPQDSTPAEKKPEDKSETLSPNIRIIASERADISKESCFDGDNATVMISANEVKDEGQSNTESFIEQGTDHLEVTNDAHHTASDAIVYQAPTASLKGNNAGAKVILNIDHGVAVNDAISQTGDYEHTSATQYLGVKTKDAIVIDKSHDVTFGIGLEGSSVTVDGVYLHTAKSLELTSTAGDVVTNRSTIRAEEKLIVESQQGQYTNSYGSVSGGAVSIHAQKDINNYAGTLQGDHIVRLTSNAYTNNIGKERYEYKMDVTGDECPLRTNIYDPAYIYGGDGVGYDGNGIEIIGEGRLTNQGAHINSIKNLIVDERLGIDNQDEKTYPLAALHGNTWVGFGGSSPDGTVTQHASMTAPNGTIIAHTSEGSLQNRDSLISGIEVSLQAPQGNMDNHQGAIVNAINYGEVVVGGDILNRCNVMDVAGTYSIMKKYFPSYYFGGTGAGHNGVGLLLSAGDWINNDASVISSFGSNVLSGTHGIISEARSNTYISYHHHSRNFFSSSDTTVYSNQVQPAMIVSFGGSNYFQSTQGGMSFLTTNFFAAHDQYFAALNNINFYSLVLEDRIVRHSSSFFGLNTHSSFQSDEYVAPTVVANPGNTTIISLEGSIQILNSLLVNSGLLTMRARDILISATPLNHTRIERSSGFNFNLPFLSSNNLTPLIADYRNLMGSQSGIEWAANAWNLGFDGFNSANSLMSAMRTGNIGQGFSPASYLTNVSISFGSSRTEAHWQTIPDNIGIRAGALIMEAYNSITFGNAVPIYISGDASIHARIFHQFGAQMHSSVESESESFSLGLSMQGVNAGESVSGYSSHSTYYQNQSFHVGGHLGVIAEEWDMENANTDAGSLDADVKKLSITSDTNTTASSSYSESLNTNGSFGFSVSSNESATIGKVSGITTSHGMNIHANEIDLTGARIASSGPSNVVARTINSTSVNEYKRGSSFGISGNVHDFYQDPNVAWQQSIPAVSVSIGSENYQAVQDGTIWNSAGTPVQANTINGSLNQSNHNGLTVTQNDHLNLQLRIPVINEAGLQQIQDNIRWLDSRNAAREKQFNNDRLYDYHDEEEKRAPEHKSVHVARPRPVARHTVVHNPHLDLEEEKGPGTLPQNLGLNLNRIDTSSMNEYAHEDKEGSSVQSRPRAGYSNLTDENESQRYSDMAFNRRENSSTGRILGRFRDQTPLRSESKDDFANDDQFADNRLPSIYDSQPVFANRHSGIFNPVSRPTSNDTYGPAATAASNDSRWQDTGRSTPLNDFSIFNANPRDDANAVIQQFSRNESDSNYIESIHYGLVGLGVAAGLGEFNLRIDDYWRAANGQWYHTKFHGNQFTGGQRLILEKANMFEIIGEKVFWADAGVKALVILHDVNEGDYLGANKAILDVVMARIGTTGPVGLGIFMAYSAGDYYVAYANEHPEMVERIPETAHLILQGGI